MAAAAGVLPSTELFESKNVALVTTELFGEHELALVITESKTAPSEFGFQLVAAGRIPTAIMSNHVVLQLALLNVKPNAQVVKSTKNSSALVVALAANSKESLAENNLVRDLVTILFTNY